MKNIKSFERDLKALMVKYGVHVFGIHDCEKDGVSVVKSFFSDGKDSLLISEALKPSVKLTTQQMKQLKKLLADQATGIAKSSRNYPLKLRIKAKTFTLYCTESEVVFLREIADSNDLHLSKMLQYLFPDDLK